MAKKRLDVGLAEREKREEQANRTACYVLQLQTLLLEADSAANDLADGDSGVDGRSVKRKAAGAGGGTGKKRKAGVIEYMGFEWTRAEADDFEVEAIVGKVVADGKATFANQASAPASNAHACPLPAPHSCVRPVAGQGEERHHSVPHRVEGLPARPRLVRAGGERWRRFDRGL